MRWWGEGTEGVWPPPRSKGMSKLFLPSSQASSGQLERKEGVSPVLHEY